MIKAGARLVASPQEHFYIHFNVHEPISGVCQSSVFCGCSNDPLTNVLLAFFIVMDQA